MVVGASHGNTFGSSCPSCNAFPDACATTSGTSMRQHRIPRSGEHWMQIKEEIMGAELQDV